MRAFCAADFTYARRAPGDPSASLRSRRPQGLNLPQDFPLAIPLLTLAGLVVLTPNVIRRPLHRATRILPGTAIRHE